MTSADSVTYDVTSYKRVDTRNKSFTPKNATYYDVIWVTITQKIKRKKKVIELSFSRYDTETEWYLDCMFVNSLPEFNHGDGCRVCLKRAAQGDLKEVIEQYVSQNSPQPGISI